MRLIIWTICFFTASSSFGGNSSGSGGDREEIARTSAWFLNPIAGPVQIINYCSEGGGTFERDTLTKALAHWERYIYAKSVNSTGFYQFAHRFVSRDVCNGSEDLTFFFGTINSRTKPVIDRFYQPVGVAYKESYDYNKLWSRGFVWIAPNHHYTDLTLPTPDQRFPAWDRPNRLLSILLHEIGHIYGIGHFEGTIMRPDVWKLTLADRTPEMGFEEIYRTRIDHTNELMRERMSGSIDPNDFEPSEIHPGMPQLFHDLTGLNPQGEVSAELQRHKLIIRDNVASHEFDLNLMSSRVHVSRDGLFKQSFSEGIYSSESYQSETFYGTLTSGHQSIPILYEYNLGESPIKLSTNRRGYLEPMVWFRSKY